MTTETVGQSISRRTMLAGSAGLVGAATLPGGGALAQNPAAGVAVNSQSSPRYYQNPAWLALRQGGHH